MTIQPEQEPDQLEQYFSRLCVLKPEEREPFLRELAEESPTLAHRVAALLDAHDERPVDIEELTRSEMNRLVSLDQEYWIGRQVAGWTLNHELGRGGLGIVFKGTRTREGIEESAAIKLLQFPLLDSEVHRRFQLEAAVLARLKHPGICGLRDWGRTEEGWPYLILDLIDGQPIHIAAAQRPVSERIVLVAKLADALSAAHRQLVVHMDIKPDNVLVDAHGQPVLLDFGVARMLTEGAGSATATLTRWLTPDYASPEQLRGESPAVAADLYALGVLLYELVTGQRPFRLVRTSIPDALETIERGPVAASRKVRSGGNDLDAVISKALHPDPERRYSSAADFADDLRALVAKRPVRARPDSMMYRLSRLVQRNPVAAPAAALSVVAIAALAGVLALQTNNLREQRDRAETEAMRARAATDLLLGSIQAADPTGEKASAATVDELLTAAARRIDGSAVDDRLLAVESLARIADVRRSLGEFDSAVELYQRALDIVEKGTVAAFETRSGVVAGLAEALLGAQRPDDAGRLLEQQMRADADGVHWKLWQARGNLAISQGQFESAREDLHRALAMLPESAHADRASILSNLGNIPSRVGRHAEAL
ncbi:MAG: protein kinase, partial [Xanthomonadales bacterium]|nr:protein kinase [Xanthomonadales bacterium]